MKEVSSLKLHGSLDVPGLTFYEPLEDEEQDVLLIKQYSEVSPTEINIHVYCTDDSDGREKVPQEYVVRNASLFICNYTLLYSLGE